MRRLLSEKRLRAQTFKLNNLTVIRCIRRFLTTASQRRQEARLKGPVRHLQRFIKLWRLSFFIIYPSNKQRQKNTITAVTPQKIKLINFFCLNLINRLFSLSKHETHSTDWQKYLKKGKILR